MEKTQREGKEPRGVLRRLLPFVLISTNAIFLLHCQRSATKSEPPPRAVFSGYKTFGWVEQSEDSLAYLTKRIADRAQIAKLVQEAANPALIAKGYQLSNTPDFFIAFETEVRDKNISSLGYNTVSDSYTPENVGSYEQGTLALAFSDAKTNGLFWRGKAKRILGDKGQLEEQIRSAVYEILAEIPSVQ